jgi:hypothetical protein
VTHRRDHRHRFNGAGSSSGVLGSPAPFDNYFAECLHAARYDAGEGEGLNDPQLDTVVEVEEDMATQEVRAHQPRHQQRRRRRRNHSVSNSGLAGGWPAAVPIAGSDSNANNQNTMRYHQDLANHVFTAAMDHIRATSAWDADAVQAQFADFDAMMIGFVGACP